MKIDLAKRCRKLASDTASLLRWRCTRVDAVKKLWDLPKGDCVFCIICVLQECGGNVKMYKSKCNRLHKPVAIAFFEPVLTDFGFMQGLVQVIAYENNI